MINLLKWVFNKFRKNKPAGTFIDNPKDRIRMVGDWHDCPDEPMDIVQPEEDYVEVNGDIIDSVSFSKCKFDHDAFSKILNDQEREKIYGKYKGNLFSNKKE